LDPLVAYFSNNLEEQGLCDVEPIKLVPDYRNFRSGTKGVSEGWIGLWCQKWLWRRLTNLNLGSRKREPSDNFPKLLQLVK
jgi:hypothetical protein